MGKSSNELEREIVELRGQLSNKSDHVRTRVQDDVSGVKDSFGQQVETVRGNLNYEALEARVRENPLAYTAGALGVGVALGILSEGINIRSSRSDPRDYARDYERQQAGGGLLGGMLGSITSNLGGTVQDEVQSLIKQAFEGFKQSPKEPTGERPPSVSASHGQAVGASRV